jgi:hypothetical protein
MGAKDIGFLVVIVMENSFNLLPKKILKEKIMGNRMEIKA